MRVLLISDDLSALDLCRRLQDEGHVVRMTCPDARLKRCYRGIVPRARDAATGLAWVGKRSLIVFDGTGHGAWQDELRRDGYAVVGGSAGGDRLEDDRAHASRVMAAAGIAVLPEQTFTDIDAASAFVQTHPGPWVVKQNGHADKAINYVGQLESGVDVADFLHRYCRGMGGKLGPVQLQRRCEGIEIGIGRYFNGHDWVGPVELNVEHKDLCTGNLGPKTWEMGTLMHFADDTQPLYRATLAKLKPHLTEIGFRGDIDINCIVNAEGVFPLEITARFGFPALQLQMALTGHRWGEFLLALARGEAAPFKPIDRYGAYGVVVLVAVPPFPYQGTFEHSACNTPLLFRTPLTPAEEAHLHLEEVWHDRRSGHYRLATDSGFALHVSGTGATVDAARDAAYALIDKIVLPHQFYRTDIGEQFARSDAAQLKEWGWMQ
jgi:phosphoribosylamine--glycine ligase